VKRTDAAGRRPAAKRPTAPGSGRSRAAKPSSGRSDPTTEEPPTRHSTITARAAILLLALASVVLAVAVPFKIWLGQRGDIASLTAQTRQTELRLSKLNAQDKRWQQPSYIEAQARHRLHYTMPGQKTHIVLGRPDRGRAAATKRRAATSTAAWYSQFWQSVQSAGLPATTK
jgi:cell division protein FtsB